MSGPSEKIFLLIVDFVHRRRAEKGVFEFVHGHDMRGDTQLRLGKITTKK